MKKLGRKAAEPHRGGDHDRLRGPACAGREGRLRQFGIPKNVGGRFSVLSPVGMLPAALIGLDIRKILKGAAGMTHLNAGRPDLKKNTALRSALLQLPGVDPEEQADPGGVPVFEPPVGHGVLVPAALGRVARQGQDAQGRNGPRGPDAGGRAGRYRPALAGAALHGRARTTRSSRSGRSRSSPTAGSIPKAKLGLEAFDYLGGQTLAKLIDAERRSTAAALAEAGRPNCTFTLEKVDAEHLGGFLQLMEFQTAFMGELLEHQRIRPGRRGTRERGSPSG